MAQTQYAGLSVLVLFRLCGMLCTAAPYTPGRARGILAAGLLQVLLFPAVLNLPEKLLRAYALGCAAVVGMTFMGVLRDLDSPAPALTALLGVVLVFRLRKAPPQNAARAAMLLVMLTGAALLLLIPRGLSHACRPALDAPGTQDFFPALCAGLAELPLVPLVIPPARRRAVFPLWVVFSAGICPLLALFCTAVGGRLPVENGRHFFLILSQIPLSDAMRTDGFWLVLAAAMSLICTLCAVQLGIPQERCDTSS